MMARIEGHNVERYRKKIIKLNSLSFSFLTCKFKPPPSDLQGIFDQKLQYPIKKD
jgi:hypothetical protein